MLSITTSLNNDGFMWLLTYKTRMTSLNPTLHHYRIAVVRSGSRRFSKIGASFKITCLVNIPYLFFMINFCPFVASVCFNSVI